MFDSQANHLHVAGGGGTAVAAEEKRREKLHEMNGMDGVHFETSRGLLAGVQAESSPCSKFKSKNQPGVRSQHGI